MIRITRTGVERLHKAKWWLFRVGPGGHPNSPTCGHPKFPHPERL